MKEHELKTDPKVFGPTLRGDKKFEIRFDDRGYRVDDTLFLRETKYSGAQMATGGRPLIYTGREARRHVTHILRGPIYGLQKGWVIMSII